MRAGQVRALQHELYTEQDMRSVMRGAGLAGQSAAFRIEELLDAQMETLDKPLTEGGPVDCIAAIAQVCGFMPREMEFAYARWGHLIIDEHRGRALLHLLASKTDMQAIGCLRPCTCTCTRGGSVARCMHRIAQQRAHTWGCIYAGRPEHENLPLFRGAAGHTVSNEAVVITTENIALGRALPIRSDDRCKMYGAHTMRVSGARWLARSGVPVPQIQMFPGWVSPIAMRYTWEAHIEDTGAFMGAQTSVVESLVKEAISWADEDEHLPHRAVGGALPRPDRRGAPEDQGPRGPARREE